MSFGQATSVQARLLPANGIELTYTDPTSPCASASYKPSYTVMSIFCDPNAGAEDVVLTSQTADCGLLYTIRTRVCPVVPPQGGGGVVAGATGGGRGLGAGWIVFIVVFVSAAVYLLAGIAYNRIKHGARGIEAIPHIAFWRAVYARLTCGNGAPAYDGLKSDFTGGDYHRAEDPAAASAPP